MINRLFFFLAAFLAGASSFAQTVTPATYYFASTSPVTQYDAKLDGVCTKAVAYLNTKNGTSYSYTGTKAIGSSTTDYYCQAKKASDPAIDFVAAYKRTCPTTQPYWDPAKLTCTATYTPPPPECGVPAGQPHRFGLFTGWGPLGSETSDQSQMPNFPRASAYCNLQGLPDVEACYAIQQEGRLHYYCVYNGVSAGTPAPGGAPNAPTEAPSGMTPERTDIPPTPAPTEGPSAGQCPRGSVMAGYNSSGTPMCVGTGTLPPSTPAAPPKQTSTSTASNTDGSTTTTTTTIINNSDGSTTTVRDIVTTLPNGGGTQTSQTRDTSLTPRGTAGVETKPEEQNFCKQNPQLSICRESSVSGTCGQIACMGDAIQCATLRAAAAMQCQQQQDIDALKASPQTALGSSILAGTDPAKGDIDAMLKGTEVDLSKPNLDSAGFLGGGSCFPNKSFSAMGQTVTMDFASVCQNIQPLRSVVMACAFIVAYLIVSRSVLSA